jgi:hypothetical protein
MLYDIVLVTVLAGNIIASTPTADLAECHTLREAMTQQQGLTAYCVAEQKQPNPEQVFEQLERVLERMRSLSIEFKEFGDPEEDGVYFNWDDIDISEVKKIPQEK